MTASTDSLSAAAATIPTLVLGHDLVRIANCDFAHPHGSLLGNGYAFNADAVLLSAENEGLNFDSFLARFLYAGFTRLGCKAPITVLVEVDYSQVFIWLCSPKRSYDVGFLTGLGPLEDYGRDVVGADARPYGHWQQGLFHRVHPAGLSANAVETFGGPTSHEEMSVDLREDIVRRPTAYGWWSVPDLRGPMVVQLSNNSVTIPQACYRWAGK